MDFGKHFRCKIEHASLEQFRNTLAYEIGLSACFIDIACVVGAHELARLDNRLFPFDIRRRGFAQIAGHVEAINILQTDSDRPIVPARRFGDVLRSFLVIEIVKAVGGHETPF